MATTTQRSYYAAHYPYGVATGSSGRLVRNVYRFETRSARNAWVDARPTNNRRNSGYREPVASSDADLRHDLRTDGGLGLVVRWADEAGW